MSGLDGVGLRDQELLGGTSSAVVGVLSEEGRLVVEFNFVGTRKCLTVLGVGDVLLLGKKVPSAILWMK